MVEYRTDNSSIINDCEFLIETLDYIKEEIVNACETQESETILNTLRDCRNTNKLIGTFLSKIVSEER